MIEQKIDALTAAITALTEALLKSQSAQPALARQEQPTLDEDAAEVKPAATAAKPVVTGPSDQDVKDLALATSRAGHGADIREKLASYGAKKIGDLNAEQVAEFYEWLATFGGQ